MEKMERSSCVGVLHSVAIFDTKETSDPRNTNRFLLSHGKLSGFRPARSVWIRRRMTAQENAGAGFQPCRRRLPEVGPRVTRVSFAHHTKINVLGSVEQAAWTAQTQDVSQVTPTACGCRYYGPGREPQHSRQRGQLNLELGCLD